MMNPFDIFIAYVSWGKDAKRRPMLVYRISDSDIMTFPITTKYEGKSKMIQARYFAINDWLQSGLHKQSFIDTGTPYIFEERSLGNAKPIGRLTENDKKRLIGFFQNII